MAQRVNKDCPQLEKDQINIFRLKASIVSQQINLSRLFKPSEKGDDGLPEGLSVKSNSFCAVNVKLRSALQHALNFPPKLAAACKHPAGCKHQRIRCYSLELTCSHFGSWRNVKQARISAIDTLGGLRRLMLTLMGAKLIRIPLSRSQLVPVVLFEVVAQFLDKSASRVQNYIVSKSVGKRLSHLSASRALGFERVKKNQQ